MIDPRRSETADLADVHLQPRPATDAWLLAALIAVIVQKGLVAHEWVAAHTTGAAEVLRAFERVPVARYCEIAGVAESLARETARRIATASSVAVAEDLGVQMNRHSTLVSWLEKVLWTLTGNYAKPGTQYAFTSLVPLGGGGASGALVDDAGDASATRGRTSPVVGARIISGLVPCNVIPDEILTDHPQRYRALIVESGNPAHSLADSQRMREAIRALELVVVLDVAMTETARLAHYVLPGPTQFEKWEATFFNFDFPKNVFHLRRPVLPAPAGVLPEPEIHARLVEALGALVQSDLAPLREALSQGREAFAQALFAATAANPRLGALLPVVLYRTLGPTLPDGAASAAALWGAAHMCARHEPASVQRAGFTGSGFGPGERLFQAILDGASGVVFAVDEHADGWKRIRTPDGRIRLAIPEMQDELERLGAEPPFSPTPEFPFVLSAGERRAYTANTIMHDPAWRTKDASGALRVCPADAERLGLAGGVRVRVTTKRGSVESDVEISDRMQPGHVSLPDGLGLDHPCPEVGEERPVWRRTNSLRARIEIRSRARRGTSRCSRGSSASRSDAESPRPGGRKRPPRARCRT